MKRIWMRLRDAAGLVVAARSSSASFHGAWYPAQVRQRLPSETIFVLRDGEYTKSELCPLILRRTISSLSRRQGSAVVYMATAVVHFTTVVVNLATAVAKLTTASSGIPRRRRTFDDGRRRYYDGRGKSGDPSSTTSRLARRRFLRRADRPQACPSQVGSYDGPAVSDDGSAGTW